MSSINSYPTLTYAQPEAYRFSHDSVFLARRVFELERDRIGEIDRVLDLCAGCGIVGLDFLFHCRKELGQWPTQCDFLEIQEEYEPFFEANRRLFGEPAPKLEWIKGSYADAGEPQYDLILCNPPYFRPGQGKLSPDSFKNRCRFFLDAGPEKLWSGIRSRLKPGGRAYVLVRELEAHGIDALAEARAVFGKVQKLEPIRGTGFVTVSLPSC